MRRELCLKFPQLVVNTSGTERRNKYDEVKETVELSVNEERRKEYHGIENEIKKSTPEECVESINHLSKAIGNAHRDILLYSSLQGELLLLLKDITTPEGFKLHLKKIY